MSVLGTTVFKVPKLGETGFKIDQVNEQKRKAGAQKQLEKKELIALVLKKHTWITPWGLTGIYKQIADSSYDVFRQAAVEYERTGSASAETRMKQSCWVSLHTLYCW